MSGDARPTRRPIEWVGWLAGAAVMVALFLAGSSLSKFEPTPANQRSVDVAVTDESGSPIRGATIAFEAARVSTDGLGRAEIALAHPVVAVVSRDGYLDEPVVVDPGDREVSVTLWSRQDADGRRRTSIHFGGDVMLGRRYLDPDRSTPFVDDERSARRVVGELAPMAAAADTTVVNLETVVGDVPDHEALAAKRFLIQSSPLVTESLDELGVDLVTLGNNHAYDWGASGLRTTMEHLDDAGIAHVGAGFDEAAAEAGRIVDSNGVRLGIVSATSVTGDYVNDNLPEPDELAPADLPEDDAWQYEERLFTLRPATAEDRSIRDTQVDLRPIRISEAWEIVEAAEEHLSRTDADDVWQLVFSAFPELQDWVARRGHGGAALYRADRVASEIARLREEGADLVVVQLHGGFQFAPVASGFLRRASHRAIDAGADAVISHHPHVLQGVEWYDGALVAHSLGNLVFDQDFHSTFPSALLRVVTDGDEILEARLLPLVLDRYRPTPLSGEAARDVVGLVNARSALPATSRRFGRHIRAVLDDPGDGPDSTDEAVTATLAFERNSGLIESVDTASDRQRQVRSTPSEPLPACSVVRADLLDPEVEIGRDLFGFGAFDDSTTAADRTFPVGWLVPTDHDRWRPVGGESGRSEDLALELTSAPNRSTTLRATALIDVPTHRLFDPSGEPIDTPAQHEIRMQVRRERGETPVLRLTQYARHDTDPTVDPFTERLQQFEIPIDVPADGAWHQAAISVPAGLFDDESQSVIALGVAVVLPPAYLATLAIDDVELLEWRGRVDADQPVWVPASETRTRNGTGQEPGAVDVTLRTC